MLMLMVMTTWRYEHLKWSSRTLLLNKLAGSIPVDEAAVLTPFRMHSPAIACS
ncbi:hypothetical protein Plhal304r1_c032g0102341 [Plasmopara halstedii]